MITAADRYLTGDKAKIDTKARMGLVVQIVRGNKYRALTGIVIGSGRQHNCLNANAGELHHNIFQNTRNRWMLYLKAGNQFV